MASNKFVKIDPSAAAADISNLKQAQTILNDAKNTVSRLNVTAAQMKGNTGVAIQNKSQQLMNMLNDLSSNLADAQRSINSAVRDYQARDNEAAAQIMKGGV